MLTHDKIWLGIDRLAAKNGYSASGLARQAGLDPTSFNKSKRTSPDGKPRWPSTESISKILAVTDCTMAGFIALLEDDKTETAKPKDVAARAAQILLDTKSVLFNAKEPFVYTSGRIGPVYTDCRRLISFVIERGELMDMGAQMLSDEIGLENIDYVAGGETAGIPFGAYLSERLEKPMLYVRKTPKGVGRMAQIEGALPEGESPNVVVVEDLLTSGSSQEVFIKALRDAGANVQHSFVIFHYGIFAASTENMKNWGMNLHALTTWWDILKVAKKKNYFDKETLESVEAFLNDPNGWGEANAHLVQG